MRARIVAALVIAAAAAPAHADQDLRDHPLAVGGGYVVDVRADRLRVRKGRASASLLGKNASLLPDTDVRAARTRDGVAIHVDNVCTRDTMTFTYDQLAARLLVADGERRARRDPDAAVDRFTRALALDPGLR